MDFWFSYLLACTALVAGTPVLRWNTYGVVDIQPVSTSTCAPFNYEICNNIANGQGYNSGLFPNPLAPQYLSDPLAAQKEAAKTFPAAISTNCSQYITKFLCFVYFPLCVGPSVPPVLPCRSMCERVRCECEPALRSFGPALQWPNWLDCDDLDKVLADYGATSVCMEADANETCTTTSNTAAPPPTVPPAVTPAPSVTPAIPSSPNQICDVVCGNCNVRTNVTAATFSITNANYSFAAKVIVMSKYENVVGGCNLTLYDVTVLQSYNMCPVPGTLTMPLPSPNATVTTNSDQCVGCIDLIPGQLYWLAGVYGDVNGVSSWIIPQFKGVAAPWIAKYDVKGPAWLLAAMTQRGCNVTTALAF